VEKLSALSPEEIKNNVPADRLRVMQIIPLAMVAGTLMFLGVCMVLDNLAGSAGPDSPRLPDDLRIMAMLVAPVALGCYGAAFFLPRLLTNPSVLKNQAAAAGADVDPVAWSLEKLLQKRIIVAAMLEAPALFGLVVLMLAVMKRHIAGHPELWLAVAPLAIQVVATLITFPSREKAADEIRTSIVEPLRSGSG
ncbi:MAG: hypothetical protein D6806_06410, partial [Deltaproteobacteria bacterium]